MEGCRILLVLFAVLAVFSACKKEKESGCFSDKTTSRQIQSKKAIVQVTATAAEPVYLVEEGTIDTRLIPCNLPLEFYQEGLQVIISGEVKGASFNGFSPCCGENFVITKITR